MDDEFLLRSAVKGSPENKFVETLLKGSEINLPKGYSFFDKDGNKRTGARVRWWVTSGDSLRDIAFLSDNIDVPLDGITLPKGYPNDAVPVFFGHYWMVPPAKLIAENVACLDFSLAKGGVLCVYRWDGEQALTEDHIVHV